MRHVRSRGAILVSLSVVLAVGGAACGRGSDGIGDLERARVAETDPTSSTATSSTDSTTSRSSGATTTTVAGGEDPAGVVSEIANRALALDPRVPRDIDLFTSTTINGGTGLYPDGPPMAPAPGPGPDAAETRRQLASHMNRFAADPALTAKALAVYDNRRVRDLMPDPMPRAAFAAMHGTILEPTIDDVMTTNKLQLVRFGSLPNAAFIAGASGGNRYRVITVNQRYAHEDFRYLIGLMGHEILHDDFPGGAAEEAILNGLSAMTYLQVLNVSPELARTGTELARQLNSLALTFLNSREHGSPDSEIVAPSGVGIAPGGTQDVPDLWTLFQENPLPGRGAGPSPGSDALQAVLDGLGLPRGNGYTASTAASFKDLDDRWLSDAQRVRALVLLEALTVEDIAAASGQSPGEVVNALDLESTLALVER